jgi:CBS domain-containing protein
MRMKELPLIVFEITSEGLQTVPSTLPAQDAWELMRRERIRHLLVTDGVDIVGVLSDRDVGTAPATGRTAGDLMTAPVVTVQRDDTIRSVANLLRGRTNGCAPVMDGHRMVGIVTTADLSRRLDTGVVGRAPKARRRRAR